jgi:AAA15 family ATPase/GTPase
MTIKIKSVDVKAFRGIVDCSFNLNGKSLLVFGENGTGKSSITTAIEFLFTEGISSLKGTQELNYKKHAPNLKSNEDDLRVDITFDNDSKLSKTLDKRYPTNINNSELKNYINETANGSFILNRNPRKDKKSRYDKLMDDIIKSGRKTKVLMLSATPVNNGLKDIKNQIELITEQKNNVFKKEGINNLQATLKMHNKPLING